MARVQALVTAMNDSERALLSERTSSEQRLAQRSVVLNRWIDMNDAARVLTGYECAELIDKPITVVIAAECVPSLTRDPSARATSGETVECVLQRKDGALVPVAMSTRKLADGRWQAFIRDISERKRLDASAVASEREKQRGIEADFFVT